MSIYRRVLLCPVAISFASAGTTVAAQAQSAGAADITASTPPTSVTPSSPPPATAGSSGDEASASAGGDIRDIVVTARRREESLQRVPVAITAFSEQKLREQSISSANDLNKAVPGLTVAPQAGDPGIPSFSIRGRGQNYGAA